MPYTVRKILAPTDFSDHSRKALVHARVFAERWNAELHLLNVIEPAVFPTEAGLTPVGIMKLGEEMESSARHNITEFASGPDLEGLVVHTDVAYGRASSAIIEYAASHQIDMIIIATHGRTGLEHLIFGSTAERVVREAPCPVLTIRPQTESTSA